MGVSESKIFQTYICYDLAWKTMLNSGFCYCFHENWGNLIVYVNFWYKSKAALVVWDFAPSLV